MTPAKEYPSTPSGGLSQAANDKGKPSAAPSSTTRLLPVCAKIDLALS